MDGPAPEPRMPPFNPFPRRPSSPRSPDVEPRDGSAAGTRDHGVLSPGYSKYAGLGIHFAVTMLVFAFGGHWLDGKLGTRPIFLIIGVFAGFTGGLISMIRKVPPATPRKQRPVPAEPRPETSSPELPPSPPRQGP